MVLLKTIAHRLLLLMMVVSISVLAENQTEPGIPELPPEEVYPSESLSKSDETPIVVVNYDDSKEAYGFFNDNGFTRGVARSLNVLDLAGYLRMRLNYFRNGHLKTYIPARGYGTSMMPPSLSLMSKLGAPVDTDTIDQGETNPTQHNFSGNMRLRIDPTINVSEVVRIKGTVDVFDNMILGSTPNYLSQHGAPNPSWPSSLMTMSQNAPMVGINSWSGAISVKRAWAEVNFPVGELKFGRIPLHWGLGILYNSGDGINNDYGDNVDGIFFTTRVFNHFITPGYHIAYTGKGVRGGGFSADNFQSFYLPAEAGQRYPLESGDMTHVFSLSMLKRDSDYIMSKKKEERRAIFNYGIFTSYRRQFLDSQAYSYNDASLPDQRKKLVKRESHVGLGSLWTAFSYGTFHIEAEAAGIWGKYKIGENENDLMAGKKEDGSVIGQQNIWLLQGGIALESKYGFLNDRLQVGLDGGWASSQGGPGFGIREGSKNNPKVGNADGRKLPSENAYKTNFRFNPAYSVDLLLYQEVLGGVSGTLYFKPHVSYFFSRNLGLRGDVLTGVAPRKENTTGNSNWLGVELDASAFWRTENGFYLQLAYGVLFPLKGLNHPINIGVRQRNLYGEAAIAQTIQAYFGVVF